MNRTVLSFLGQQDSEVLEYVLLEKVDQLGQGNHNQQNLSRFSLMQLSFGVLLIFISCLCCKFLLPSR